MSPNPQVPVFRDICRYYDPVKGFDLVSYLVIGSKIIEPMELYGETIEAISLKDNEITMKTNKGTYTYREPYEFLVEKEGYRVRFRIEYLKDVLGIIIVEPEADYTELIEIAKETCGWR